MKRTSRGFTLIEMLVSLSIFAVVTGFVIANLAGGRAGEELRLSSNLIASEIRRARTMAVTGTTVFFCRGSEGEAPQTCPSGRHDDCPEGSFCVREVPVGGYGIRFATGEADRRTFILFADVDGEYDYDAGEAIRSGRISPGALVSVVEVDPVGPADNLDIVFRPPKPVIRFNNEPTAVTGAVSIQFSDMETARKQISVNAISGQVSIGEYVAAGGED